MIFDTHSHCYFENLLPRIDEILENMKQNNVCKATQIAVDFESSFAAIELAKKYPNIFYATVWFHPETAQNWEPDKEKIKKLEKIILENREYIVAIGECGFDFHYLDGTQDGKIAFERENASEKAKKQIENQKFWFQKQWELAKKYHLPVVIHTRDARNETLDFMKKNSINYAVMHCYSEDLDMAKELLSFSDNIYFSFSGIVTYKKSVSVQETAKMLPKEKILVETDSPFLAPQSVRWTINEPANTRENFKKICQLRDENAWELEEQIYKNSLKFYQITV